MFYFFFNDTATTEIYTLSLHDALPISYVEKVMHRDYLQIINGWFYTENTRVKPAIYYL